MEEMRRQHHRASERQQQEIEALRRDKEVVERQVRAGSGKWFIVHQSVNVITESELQLEAELERADQMFEERLGMLSGTA